MKPNNLHTDNAAMGCGKKTKKLVALISFLIAFLGTSTLINAATYTFTSSGQWSASSKWSGNNKPPTPLVSGDTIIISTDCTLNAIQTINSGAFLIVNSGVTLTFSATNSLTVNGTLFNYGTISSSTTSIFSFATGGTYVHAQNGGTIPTASYDPASNCKLTGVTSYPSGMDQTFGNVIFNPNSFSTTLTMTSDLTSKGDLIISQGTLNTNNKNITIGGNWTNNGSFTSGTGTVTFNGTTQQTISGTNSTTFNNITISNSNGVLLGKTETINGNLNLTSGKLSLSGNTLTLASTATIIGASSSNYIVTDGANARLVINNLSPSATTTFPIGTSTLYLPVSLKPDASGTNFSVRVFKGATKNATENSTPVPFKSSIVDAVWIVNNTTTTNTSAQMTLQWDATLQGTSFNINQVGVSNFNTTTTSWDPATSPISINGSNSITASVSNFTAFGIGPIGTPLPIVLKFFTGAPVKNTAQLNWETANDDARQFILEKSTNGKDFSTVTTIASNLTRQYAYTDPIQAGINYYYRLKMQELDGTYTYSNVVNIKSDKMTDPVVTVYPNPATNWLELNHSLLTTAAKAEITDLQGRVIISQDIESNVAHTKINISNLPQGYFMVRIKGDALNFSQAFLHQ